jgi:hypothetical protein
MQKIIKFIKENKALTLILCIATILRFYKINFQSLWLDEIYTMNITNPENSFGTIITEVNNKEGFPYLYFLLLKILHTVFGYSPIVTRGLSALFGVLSVYAISKLGEKMYSKKAGLFAAILLTFSEYAIYISQDARPYTLYLFFTIISYIGLVDFIKNPTKQNAIKYGIYVGLLLNSSFFGPINVLVQIISMAVIYSKTSFKEITQIFKKLLISAGIALVFFLPNVYKLTTILSFKSTWIPAPTNESLSLILKEFLGNSEITLFLYGAIFIYFMISFFSSEEDNSDTNKQTNKEFSFILLLIWISVFLIVIFLKTYLDTSLYISRYFTSIIPAIFLIFGISFANIKSNIIKNLFLFSICVFMFLNLTIVKGHYRWFYKTQFREASQLIIDNNKNKEPVYTGLKYWFDYYLKSNFNTIEKPDLESLINEMMVDSSKVKPFWYTDAHGKPFKLSDKAQQFVDGKFYIDESFDGSDAWTRHFILEKDAVSKIDLKSYQPLKVNNGDLTKVWIEVFEQEATSYKISGWGFLENIDSKNNKISIVLINNLDAKVIKCQQFPRTDITKAENKNINFDNSGFISNIHLEKLQKGDYKIGVLIENKKENKKGLYLSDKKIIIN